MSFGTLNRAGGTTIHKALQFIHPIQRPSEHITERWVQLDKFIVLKFGINKTHLVTFIFYCAATVFVFFFTILEMNILWTIIFCGITILCGILPSILVYFNHKRHFRSIEFVLKNNLLIIIYSNNNSREIDLKKAHITKILSGDIFYTLPVYGLFYYSISFNGEVFYVSSFHPIDLDRFCENVGTNSEISLPLILKNKPDPRFSKSSNEQ